MPCHGSIATAEPPQSSATTVKQRQWKRRCGAAQPTTNKAANLRGPTPMHGAIGRNALFHLRDSRPAVSGHRRAEGKDMTSVWCSFHGFTLRHSPAIAGTNLQANRTSSENNNSKSWLKQCGSILRYTFCDFYKQHDGAQDHTRARFGPSSCWSKKSAVHVSARCNALLAFAVSRSLLKADKPVLYCFVCLVLPAHVKELAGIYRPYCSCLFSRDHGHGLPGSQGCRSSECPHLCTSKWRERNKR